MLSNKTITIELVLGSGGVPALTRSSLYLYKAICFREEHVLYTEELIRVQEPSTIWIEDLYYILNPLSI